MYSCVYKTQDIFAVQYQLCSLSQMSSSSTMWLKFALLIFYTKKFMKKSRKFYFQISVDTLYKKIVKTQIDVVFYWKNKYVNCESKG